MNGSETTSHFTASGGPVSRDSLGRASGWNGATSVVVGIWETAGHFLWPPSLDLCWTNANFIQEAFLPVLFNKKCWAEGEKAQPSHGLAGPQEGSRLTHRFNSAGPFPLCVS